MAAPRGPGRSGRAALVLASSVLAFLALAGTGCETLTSSYWDETRKHADADAAEADVEPLGAGGPHVHFLGIRASDVEEKFQIGVTLLHVFGASPAARAGLEPGDELRSLDQRPVRSAADVKDALAATLGGDRETVPIVYAREGREYQTTVDLVTRDAYFAFRRQRLYAESAYGESEFPFFFRHVSRELSPGFLLLYYGVLVPDGVTVYDDLTIFPLIPGVAVFRLESLPLVDSTRVQVWHWPLRWTTDQDDRSDDLRGLAPPAPEKTRDL